MKKWRANIYLLIYNKQIYICFCENIPDNCILYKLDYKELKNVNINNKNGRNKNYTSMNRV